MHGAEHDVKKNLKIAEEQPYSYLIVKGLSPFYKRTKGLIT